MGALPDRRAEARGLLRGSIVAMAEVLTCCGQLAMMSRYGGLSADKW